MAPLGDTLHEVTGAVKLQLLLKVLFVPELLDTVNVIDVVENDGTVELEVHGLMPQLPVMLHVIRRFRGVP